VKEKERSVLGWRKKGLEKRTGKERERENEP